MVITNAVGHAATYTLEPMGDGRRRVVAINGKAGNTCPQLRQRNHFNQDGFLDLAADDDQQGRIMQRNKRGLIETEYEGVHIAADNTWTPAEGSLKITRTWHPQLPLVTTATSYRYHANQWQPVLKNSYAYDARGNAQSETAQDLQPTSDATAAPLTRQWTYTRQYQDTQQRNLAALIIKDPLGHNTQLHYDPLGRLTTTVNAAGHTTAFNHYNSAHLPQTITLPNGQHISLQYDNNQRMTTIARGDNTEREETHIDYLANGLVSHLQLANGSEFHFTYNTARQLTSIKNGRGETQTLDLSKLNGDWLNRTITDASGRASIKQQRRQDEWGRLLSWLGNSGQLTELAYNEAGDLTAVHEGEAKHATTAANTAPENERTAQAKYDTLHRLVELIDAAGYATQIDYSHSGGTEAITDANGNKTRYVRNGFGEVLKEVNPARGDDTYRYDALGNITQRNQTQLQYDALNRLTHIDSPGEDDDIQYTYDQTDAAHGNGIQQLTQIKSKAQIIDYRYDDAGRRIAETTRDEDSIKKFTRITTLQYRYLPGNRLESITYPDGSIVHYRYHKERISEVTYTDTTDPTKAEKSLLKNIVYAPFGGPQQWTYGNGLTQQIDNDLDGRVKAITLRNDKTLWQQTYGYDAFNNIKQIERLSSDQTRQPRATQQFDYDLLHRLTAENSDGKNTQYHYDAVGNRLEDVEGGKATKLAYTTGNRLTQRGDNKITLDTRGNLLEDTQTISGNVTQRRFEYNAQNRPISFYKDGKLSAQYHYNANGLRDSKTLIDPNPEKTQTTQFIYAPDTRLLSASNTAITTHYIWLGASPIAQIEKPTKQISENSKPTQITYLHTDHLLTPRIATNEQQTIVWRWQSDAFGETLAENDPDKDGKATQINLRFPGQYADEESGLYYNVFRYYDPQSGRYTQSDPIGLGGGVNSFAYVGGQPLMLSDKMGLRPLTADEMLFLTNYFGSCLDGSLPNFDIEVRSVGDTSRAISMNGGLISLPRSYFVDGDPNKEINLSDAYTASVFGHESLHQLQRSQGKSVTISGAFLQIGYSLGMNDPYSYQSSTDPDVMLATYKNGNVEMQGQIFQDYIYNSLLGRDVSNFTKIGSYVRDDCSCGK